MTARASRPYPSSFLTPAGPIELSASVLSALDRLAEHPPHKDPWPAKPPGIRGRAAVLLALFPSRDGQRLNVLLSRRSSGMRSYPGQTSLPGGKVEEQDGEDLEMTARREAMEEVGLPLDKDRVRYLTTLAPTLSRAGLLITPIVAFVLDHSIRPALNWSEVASLFSFPLEGFLTTQPPPPTPYDPILPPYHTSIDYTWFDRRPFRFHTFRLPAREAGEQEREVVGLTAGILIDCAVVAYGRQPDFELRAPNQMTLAELVACAEHSPLSSLPGPPMGGPKL